MKKLLVLSLLALLATITRGETPTNTLPEIRFQADRWMPINGRPDEDPPGYAIELLVNIFTDTHNVKYTLNPWPVALQKTENGESDGAIGAAKDEAPELIFPKESIGRLEFALWSKKDYKGTLTDATYSQAKIGVIAGYTYWAELDKAVKNKAPNIIVFSGEEPLAEAIDALINGDIDYLAEASAVFAWGIQDKKGQLTDYKKDHPYDSGDIFIAFNNSPKGQALANQWDEGIAKLRQSGELSKILTKYHLSDWKNNTK